MNPNSAERVDIAVAEDRDICGPLDSADLARKMLTSSFWVAVSGGANQAVSFVIFVVIARLVTPTQFGLVALAALLIELMQIISTAGIADAVIQRPTLDDRTADSAFWLNLTMGLGVAAIAMALAQPLGALFGVMGLPRVIRLLALTLLIAPFGSIHAARLAREFGFRSLAIRNVVANLASGAIGVWMAIEGWGVDALIVQRLSAAAATSAIGFFSYCWWPRLRIDAIACRELARFALKIVGAQLFLMVNVRSVELLAGFLLGPIAVATIRVANRCIDMLMQLTIAPFQQIALPVLSRAQHDSSAACAAYSRLTRLSALVIYPSFAGAMALAPFAVPAVFGQQWREAGLVMQVICLAAIPLHFNMLLPATLAASGNPGHVIGWSAAQFGLGVATAIIGAQFGILGLVGGNLCRAYLLLPLGVMMLQRSAGIRPEIGLGAISRPLLASVLMAVCVYMVQSNLSGVLPMSIRLTASVAAGLISYSFLVLVLMGKLLPSASEILPPRARPFMDSILRWLPARLLES